MKLIFYYHHYSRIKKVKLVIEFINYNIIWWDRLVLEKNK
jgi:hypothetical protein